MTSSNFHATIFSRTEFDCRDLILFFISDTRRQSSLRTWQTTGFSQVSVFTATIGTLTRVRIVGEVTDQHQQIRAVRVSQRRDGFIRPEQVERRYITLVSPFVEGCLCKAGAKADH